MQRFTARMPLLTAKTSQLSAVKLRLTFLFIVAAVKAHSSQSAYNDTDQQITHKTGDRKFTKLKKSIKPKWYTNFKPEDMAYRQNPVIHFLKKKGFG